MAVMDEFKEEREALKHGTPKEKLNYFWYYYKWHVIISVIIIAIVISFVHQMLNRREVAFSAVMLNASALNQESTLPDFAEEFAALEGIDLNSEDLSFDTSIRIEGENMDEISVTSSQKLMVYVAANELDTMITDRDSFQKYANSSLFYDLRDILTEEQINTLEPYFYYVDRAVVLAIEEANDNLDTDYTPTYPDPLHPEEMEDPVPVGICLDSSKALTDNYYFRGEGVVMGIYANAQHADIAVDLAEYLLNK